MKIRLELNSFALALIAAAALLVVATDGGRRSLRVNLSVAPVGSATEASASVEGIGTVSLRLSR